VAQLVEALHFKPEFHGHHWNLSLTEISTRNISWGLRRPVRRARRQPYHLHVPIVSKSGNHSLLSCPGIPLPI